MNEKEVFHDSIELVIHDVDNKKNNHFVKQSLLKKWFIRWKDSIHFNSRRSVNDSDSNPSDSTSEDSSRTDNTNSTPELIEMEQFTEDIGVSINNVKGNS